MKEGRRHGERNNNQGKEGEKMRMKKENKSCKGKRAKKKTQVKKSKRKTEREDEGRKAGGSGVWKVCRWKSRKMPLLRPLRQLITANQTKPAERVCHTSLFLFAGTQPACDHELRKSNTRTLYSTAQTPWTAHQRPRLSAVSGKKQKQHQSEFRLL